MSPEKVTVIFRDGWDPIGSKKVSKEEQLEAEKNIEESFKELGITLNLQKVTLVDLYI